MAESALEKTGPAIGPQVDKEPQMYESGPLTDGCNAEMF